MTGVIGFGMVQPVLNEPCNKWRQKRYHCRIPRRGEAKWYLDAKYTKQPGGIAPIPPNAVGSLSPWAITNNTGNQTYATAGGFSGPSIVYSLVSPPTGITINSSTGVITANTSLTAAGSSTLTVKATNVDGFATQTIALTIAIAAPVATGTLSNWALSVNTGSFTYNATVGFTGPSLVYSLVSPPTGVTINAGTGIITANTNLTGSITVTITVNATNASGVASQTFTLDVAAAVPPAMLDFSVAANSQYLTVVQAL